MFFVINLIIDTEPIQFVHENDVVDHLKDTSEFDVLCNYLVQEYTGDGDKLIESIRADRWYEREAR